MKLYNFARLIQKYSTQFFFLIPSKGHFESGKWIEGNNALQSCMGAIIPMPEERIKQSGGVYTIQDRELYMLSPIPKALEGAKVCHGNNMYSVEKLTDYGDFADVYVYVLKWVSLFDREAVDYYA